MGLLINGEWRDQWDDTSSSGGRFLRKDSAYRNWVTVDGAPGFTGHGGFPAELGRYHLYVSLACPWAHRTLILRSLKGLEAIIPASVVHWRMLEDGWTFEDGPGVVPDPNLGAKFLYEIYIVSDPNYTGRVTVPVLWDKRRGAIVNNESSEIIRMMNCAFNALGAKSGDYYPEELRLEIESVNARVYDTLNNGVYKAGFATSQTAYEEAIAPLFETLDWLESRLASARYLVGNRLTEAASAVSSSPNSPFGMDQLLRSLLRQNGPPGWTSRTIGLRPEWRNMRIPALRLTELLPTETK